MTREDNDQTFFVFVFLVIKKEPRFEKHAANADTYESKRIIIRRSFSLNFITHQNAETKSVEDYITLVRISR